MSTLVVSDKAQKALAAGQYLEAAQNFLLGKIDKSHPYVQTGNGSQDNSAPVEVYIRYTNQTGDVTINLNSLTGPAGESINLAGVRSIVVNNLATNSAHVLTVGAAASTPFLGPLAGTTPTIKVEPGAAAVIVNKPLGAAYTTSSANNLKLAFGANTFSAEVIIKGNV